MSKLVEIVEGWTEELEAFTLKASGTAVNLTGMTVELILTTKEKVAVTLTGTVRVDDDPTTGRVYYKPTAADLQNDLSPYGIRWKVTDGAGDAVFFPNNKADELIVFKP